MRYLQPTTKNVSRRAVAIVEDDTGAWVYDSNETHAYVGATAPVGWEGPPASGTLVVSQSAQPFHGWW